MRKNKKLSCFISCLFVFSTSIVIAQHNGNPPPFSISRNTFITTAASIGLGYKLPTPDTTENGIIVDPPDDATKPYIWGFRGSGQQGNGVHAVAANAAPAGVNNLPPIEVLTGGAYHVLALSTKGELYGWGQTGYGETGCKTGGYALTPCKINLGSKVTYVSAGEYFSIAITEKGEVFTWGHNAYRQLGNGNATNTHIPQKVNLQGETARLMGGAYEGAFAVTKEGHVWAWGDNEAYGLGFKQPRYAAVPTHVPNLDKYAPDIIYIGGGNGWGQALLQDGTVIGWGFHASIGQGTTNLGIYSDVPVVVTTNIDHMHTRFIGTIALTRDGEILTWGQTGGSAFPMIYGTRPTLRQPVANDKVIAVGGGKEHIFYRTESGRLIGVGYNDIHKIDQKRFGGIINWPGIDVIINP